MKQLLFFTLFIAFTLPLTVSAQGIELQVREVKIAVPYSTVIQKLGKPLSRKKGGTFPCNWDEPVLKLSYPGLIVTFIEANDGTGFIVAKMEVTSPNWSVASGIKVGVSVKEVQAKFGQPEGKKTKSGLKNLSFGMAEGFANFYFRNNRLVKVAWEFNIC